MIKRREARVGRGSVRRAELLWMQSQARTERTRVASFVAIHVTQ